VEMESGLESRYQRLKQTIACFDRVAVAFSGGVDSSLLLKVCCDVLGQENVLGLQGVSCLLSDDVLLQAEQTFTGCTEGQGRLERVEFFPLEWDRFVLNGDDRCYLCKAEVYSSFLKRLKDAGCKTLVDGTNVDDFQEQRPGLRAIEELGVQTPLLEAGLRKAEIRELARLLGLKNHDLPSNSCLATRISRHTRITRKRLEVVDQAELILKRLGFAGCRVRPSGDQVVIEVQEQDISRIVQQGPRDEIVRKFKSLGFLDLRLNLAGRKG